jgi:AcrR family transcriptional regulator
VAYHHGNLRRALLDAALDLFVQRGAFDFTLRELAREAGVTHNAPYRHFAGKNELLAAIREEGFAMLAAAAQAAIETVPEPRARVRALGDAYVRFAIERPHHFRLMLSEQTDSVQTTGAFDLLRKTLEEGRAAGVVRSDLSARELALAAWALVHGLASLVVNGQLPGDEARLRRYQKTLDAVFFEGALERKGHKRGA